LHWNGLHWNWGGWGIRLDWFDLLGCLSSRWLCRCGSGGWLNGSGGLIGGWLIEIGDRALSVSGNARQQRYQARSNTNRKRTPGHQSNSLNANATSRHIDRHGPSVGKSR